MTEENEVTGSQWIVKQFILRLTADVTSEASHRY